MPRVGNDNDTRRSGKFSREAVVEHAAKIDILGKKHDWWLRPVVLLLLSTLGGWVIFIDRASYRQTLAITGVQDDLKELESEISSDHSKAVTDDQLHAEMQKFENDMRDLINSRLETTIGRIENDIRELRNDIRQLNN